MLPSHPDRLLSHKSMKVPVKYIFTKKYSRVSTQAIAKRADEENYQPRWPRHMKKSTGCTIVRPNGKSSRLTMIKIDKRETDSFEATNNRVSKFGNSPMKYSHCIVRFIKKKSFNDLKYFDCIPEGSVYIPYHGLTGVLPYVAEPHQLLRLIKGTAHDYHLLENVEHLHVPRSILSNSKLRLKINSQKSFDEVKGNLIASVLGPTYTHTSNSNYSFLNKSNQQFEDKEKSQDESQIDKRSTPRLPDDYSRKIFASITRARLAYLRRQTKIEVQIKQAKANIRNSQSESLFDASHRPNF